MSDSGLPKSDADLADVEPLYQQGLSHNNAALLDGAKDCFGCLLELDACHAEVSNSDAISITITKTSPLCL